MKEIIPNETGYHKGRGIYQPAKIPAIAGKSSLVKGASFQRGRVKCILQINLHPKKTGGENYQ